MFAPLVTEQTHYTHPSMTTYWSALFTWETWQAFRDKGSEVMGFPRSQLARARRVQPGDHFLCYVVGLMRWTGVLEVVDGPYLDDSPHFVDSEDLFVVRFRVRPLLIADIEKGVPIKHASLWNHLSRTRTLPLDARSWVFKARLICSLVEQDVGDGTLIESVLAESLAQHTRYPFNASDEQLLKRGARKRGHSVRTDRGDIVVSVPENTAPAQADAPSPVGSSDAAVSAPRESHRIQATLASIGIALGFRAWVPRNDKEAVIRQLDESESGMLLDMLPIRFDEATIRTIENIDVLWLMGSRIVRAFEVEHTTAIYSGILRMADLRALQPNISLPLHIVAPSERREKVLEEIRRPVFAMLAGGSLSSVCTYIAYDAVDTITALPNLRHSRDSIVEEYEESADEQ